jgi:2-oxo-4-hydroxy-4-carboxy-5-ureidoimidazoline decarboxylase
MFFGHKLDEKYSIFIFKIYDSKMTLQELNQATPSVFQDNLFKCCGSKTWVEAMETMRPFSDKIDLLDKADTCWFKCKKKDWMEAFTHHPRIGDVESLREKFAATAAWASGEQGKVKEASEQVIQELKRLNDAYFDEFGFIFIVFATGKSAQEMLSILKERIENDLVEEIINAMMEQCKITKLRLEKLLS